MAFSFCDMCPYLLGAEVKFSVDAICYIYVS